MRILQESFKMGRLKSWRVTRQQWSICGTGLGYLEPSILLLMVYSLKNLSERTCSVSMVVDSWRRKSSSFCVEIVYAVRFEFRVH